MKFLVIAALSIVGILAGPVQHSVAPGSSEKYEIRLVVDSVKYPWSITQWEKNTNTGTIITAITHYSHMIDHSTNIPAPTLPSTPGYQGYEVDHLVNGVSLHNLVIPKCRLPGLEKVLLQYTGPRELINRFQSDVKTAVSSCK